MRVVDLVSATQDVCAGPLAAHSAARLALRTALLALITNTSKIIEQHRKAWGFTGSREDKVVSVDRIPLKTGRKLRQSPRLLSRIYKLCWQPVPLCVLEGSWP